MNPIPPLLNDDEVPPREVTGNQPLPLDDPDIMWMVSAGTLDVFAVPLRDGQASGARVHLFRAQTGQSLFGLKANVDGHGLVAIGLPGARVQSVTRARLGELAADPEQIGVIAHLIEGWIESLTTGVCRVGMPKATCLLEPGGSTAFDAGDTLTPARDLIWVKTSTGNPKFLGRNEVLVAAADAWFPMAKRGWLEADTSATVIVETSENLLAAGELWPGLERFHAAALECVALNLRDEINAGWERLQRKSANEGRLIQSTLAQLAAVSKHEGTPTEATLDTPITAGAEDPLVAACRLVGGAMGVIIQTPHHVGERQKAAEPVAAIARASRLRSRRVLLSGDWWRRDNGPLLAYRADNERPVALLPCSPGVYDLVDPLENTRIRVSAANAGLLGAFGYCFYAPFPERPLTPITIFRFGLRGTRRDWIVILLLGLGGGLLSMLAPIATGWIFDRIIPGGDRGQLVILALALAVCALAATLFQITQGIATLRVESRAESTIEAGLWDRLLNLPVPFFRAYMAGDLAVRASGIAAMRQTLSQAALSSLLSAVFSLLSFVLLFYYSPTLAWLAVGMFMLVVAVTIGSAYLQIQYERQDYEMRGKISGLVLQLITGISRLRVAAAESRALAVWALAFGRQRKIAYRARSIANAIAAFNAAIPILAALALFASAAFTLDKSISLGVFLAFFAAYTQVLMGAVEVSSAVTSLLEVVPLYERASPILQTAPEIDLNKAHPGELTGDIEISHVSFRYDSEGPLVLDDISLHIRPGEFVAFVGPSGAGKSSLFRLLLGFESPASGSIFYDREDLAGLDLQAVRRQIGVVLQQARIMPGELYRNIIGSSLLTLDDAWDAARLSGFEADIKQMPMGMFTIIGEGGTTLSGGQRQRLMIARALAPKPRILFFDEATSALDNATQAKVSRSLDSLKATRVVVAHRLSTILKADRIYVMQAGKIVQTGSYDQLMRQEGLFADLVKRQLL